MINEIRSAIASDIEDVLTIFPEHESTLLDAFGENDLMVMAQGRRIVGVATSMFSPIILVKKYYRRRGYGSELVSRVKKEWQNQGVCEGKIATDSKKQARFLRNLGFNIVGASPYNEVAFACHPFPKKFDLQPGLAVDVKFEILCEAALYGDGGDPLETFNPPAIQVSATRVEFAERLIISTLLWRGDRVARIFVDGQEILFDKMKRESAARKGIQQDSQGTFFIDGLIFDAVSS